MQKLDLGPILTRNKFAMTAILNLMPPDVSTWVQAYVNTIIKGSRQRQILSLCVANKLTKKKTETVPKL